MSRGWTPPIVACALAVLVWNCAGGTGGRSTSAPKTPSPVPASPPAASAAGIRSTLTGVYAEDQAALGKDIYAGRCVSCHSGDHIGPQFRSRWAGTMLSNMYGLMVETMPQDNPGSLSREEYVRVIAYLLKANGMPAGDAPLPVDSLALSKIRLDTVGTKK